MSKNTNKKQGSPFSIHGENTTNGTISASNDHFAKRDRDDFQDQHVFSREELW